MRRTTRIQKFLSLLLAFCMVLVLLPATAFAVSDTKPEDDWTQQIEDRIDIHETENDALSFDETDVIEGAGNDVFPATLGDLPEELETDSFESKERAETGKVEKLDVMQEDEVAVMVETNGSSIYTVEFTYNMLEYSLPGDSTVLMSEILSALGLVGEVEAVAISDESLFSVSNAAGEWVITAHQSFSTTEWMKVTINGVVYEITVTDEQTISGMITENTTWANGSTIKGSVHISGGTESNPIVISIPGTVTLTGEGEITFGAGAHVRFVGNSTEASKLIMNSTQPAMFMYQHPEEPGRATIGFDKLTMDFNQKSSGLWFYASATTPMQVDFTDTVITNSKCAHMIYMANCFSHFRSGTKITNNQCHLLIQSQQTDGTEDRFTNTVYLYDGCEISDNTCSQYLLDEDLYTAVVMYGGTIQNNTMNGTGAELISIKNGTMDIYGGSIKNNTSNAYMIDNYRGTLNIYDGSFTGNTSANGGVLLNLSYVSDTLAEYGVTNIYGGTFSNNNATSGGGAIWNNKDSILNLYGGTFTGNAASGNGGAIYSSGVINIAPASGKSLSITGNIAANTGGGIAMGTTGMLTLGGANINLNANSSSNDKGADLAILADHPATVTSALTGSIVSFSLMDAPGAGGNYTTGTAFTYGENVSLGDNVLQLNQSGFLFGLETGSVTKAPHTVTIADGIEHGTVTADKASAAAGDTVTLTVTPETGYALDTLTVMQGETEVTVTNNQFTMPAGDVIVSATFKALTGPAFKCQSLVLSGQIGVNFFLDLSALTDAEREASYMTFAISGNGTTTERDDFDATAKNITGAYYGFTCYLTSIQMADTITATFHYKGNQTIEKTYSVKEYLSNFSGTGYDSKTVNLIHAIADYGHYAQPFLSAANGWTIGTDYAEMDMVYTTSYEYEAIKQALSKEEDSKVIFKDFDSSAVDTVTFSLNLNSDTELNVFIKPVAGNTIDASVIVNGTTYSAVLQNDGRYKITIPGISAHLLGDMFEITGKAANGTDESNITIRVSALSYVYSVLNSDSFDDTAKKAVSALYAYYDAVMKYRDSQS